MHRKTFRYPVFTTLVFLCVVLLGACGAKTSGGSDVTIPAETLTQLRGETGAAGKDGKDGKDGLTPFVGENGNWWIGDTDTGVTTQESGVFLSGVCGTGANWMLYKDGSLVLSGPTAEDASPVEVTTTPWLDFRHFIVATRLLGKIRSLPAYAFDGCSFLASAELTEGVETIGAFAFRGCGSLQTIVFPDSLTAVGEGAFSGCAAEVRFASNGSLRVLSRRAFAGYGGLTLALPQTLSGIGPEAFADCARLAAISIPDTVWRGSIGEGIFRGCSSLLNVSVPFVGETAAGEYPFGYYFGREEYEGSVPVTQNARGRETTYYLPKTLTEATVSVATELGAAAFMNCSGLRTVSLPKVEGIPADAFSGCTGITEVSAPKVRTVGKQAFDSCSSLREMSAIGALFIGNSAFRGCRSLTKITLGRGLTAIDVAAFSGCSSLMRINYVGTKEEWSDVTKGTLWQSGVPDCTVFCTDGTAKVR